MAELVISEENWIFCLFPFLSVVSRHCYQMNTSCFWSSFHIPLLMMSISVSFSLLGLSANDLLQVLFPSLNTCWMFGLQLSVTKPGLERTNIILLMPLFAGSAELKKPEGLAMENLSRKVSFFQSTIQIILPCCQWYHFQESRLSCD